MYRCKVWLCSDLPGYVIEDGIHQDRQDEHPSFDVVSLYEKWRPDGQEPLDRDGNRRVARSSQTYLQDEKKCVSLL